MKIQEIKLLQFVELESYDESQEQTTASPSGYFLRAEQIRFVSHVDKLNGIKGLKFGIEYFLKGFTEGIDDVEFISKLSHPTIVNPNTGETFNETIDIKIGYLNHSNFDYYNLEYDWEIVKGTWTFEIIEDTKLLLKKEFEIQ